MIRLQIGAGNVNQLDTMLGLAEEIVGDLQFEWESVLKPWFLDHMEEQYETQGAHGGEPWADYSSEPQYAAMKSSVFEQANVGGSIDNFILRWVPGSERLKPSLTESSHPNFVFRTSDLEAEIGTNVPYAERLIEGGTGPFGEPYPGRDMLAMTDAQLSTLFTEIQRGIQDRIGTEAFREARRRFQSRNL